MSMMRRIAATAPEKLVSEISRLRNDRDNLRDALALKMTDFARSLSIGQEDILIVRRPDKLSPETILEVVEKVAGLLASRYDWHGTVIVGSETEGIDKLTEDEKKNIYYILKAKFEESKERGTTDAKP